jgi:hypothetical protein
MLFRGCHHRSMILASRILLRTKVQTDRRSLLSETQTGWKEKKTEAKGTTFCAGIRRERERNGEIHRFEKSSVASGAFPDNAGIVG